MTRRPDDFDLFVVEESGRLLRAAYLLCGDWGAAEDLVQEVLERMYVAWPRVTDPVPYARKILVNQARNRWRWRRRRPEVALAPADEQACPDATDDRAERDRLLRAIRSLSPGQRAVVVLRFYEDLPEQEVAAVLGCSTGTVKSQTSRALARLRRVLGPAWSAAPAGRQA